MKLRFFWNGIKEDGGKLQRCLYSDGELRNFPAGTISIYKRDYTSFSDGVKRAFTVRNDTDTSTDYFDHDRIRVEPTHPLYAQVRAALMLMTRHNTGIAARKRRREEAKLALQCQR